MLTVLNLALLQMKTHRARRVMDGGQRVAAASSRTVVKPVRATSRALHV